MNTSKFVTPRFIVGAVSAVSLLVVLLFSYGSINEIRSSGIAMETSLSAQYESNQNELSAYVTSFYEQTGLINRRDSSFDNIIRGAVEGRYGDEGFSSDGAFFSAIQENYPDLAANNKLYEDMAVFIRAGREAFKGKQNQLLDRARVYKVFLNDGIIRSRVVRGMLGFPSNVLEARVGGKVLATGPEALNQIQNIVVTGSTVDAFTTGRAEPLR
jgi:hypothetical protein